MATDLYTSPAAQRSAVPANSHPEAFCFLNPAESENRVRRATPLLRGFRAIHIIQPATTRPRTHARGQRSHQAEISSPFSPYHAFLRPFFTRAGCPATAVAMATTSRPVLFPSFSVACHHVEAPSFPVLPPRAVAPSFEKNVPATERRALPDANACYVSRPRFCHCV